MYISCFVFQRSFSLRSLVSNYGKKSSSEPKKLPPLGLATPTRVQAAKRRLSSFWHETMADEEVQRLGKAALERQEVCDVQGSYVQFAEKSSRGLTFFSGNWPMAFSILGPSWQFPKKNPMVL